jgi:hypothetical protein
MTSNPTFTNTSIPYRPATEPICPLPELYGRAPVVLVRDDDSDLGVEIAYESQDDPLGTRIRVTTRTGLAPFYVPPYTPVLAAADGVVRFAAQHASGHRILIEHSDGWLSYYARLQQSFVVPTSRRLTPQDVKAGQMIGHAGRVHEHPPKPMRFELWFRDEHGYKQIDPTRLMRHWRLLRWAQVTGPANTT